jgi:hypothetical protein
LRVTASAVLGAAWLSGCAPIPWSYRERPDIDGRLSRADGVGFASEVLVGDIRDTLCAAPVAKGAADSTGRFQIPGAMLHSRWTLLLPMDRVMPVYSLCVPTHNGPREVYRGYVRQSAARDSIACVARLADTAESLECVGPRPMSELLATVRRRR